MGPKYKIQIQPHAGEADHEQSSQQSYEWAVFDTFYRLTS